MTLPSLSFQTVVLPSSLVEGVVESEFDGLGESGVEEEFLVYT